MYWNQGIYFRYIGLVSPLQGSHLPFDTFPFFSSLSTRCCWSASIPLILYHPCYHSLHFSLFHDCTTLLCLPSLWTSPSCLILSLIISMSFHKQHSLVTKSFHVGAEHILLSDFHVIHMFWNWYLRNKSSINQRFPNFWFHGLLYVGDMCFDSGIFPNFFCSALQMLLVTMVVAVLNPHLMLSSIHWNLEWRWLFKETVIFSVTHILNKAQTTCCLFSKIWNSPFWVSGFPPEDMEQGFAHSLPCNK